MGITREQFKCLKCRPLAIVSAKKFMRKPAIPKSRYRSKIEAAYAAKLEAMKRVGEIVYWRYEAVTFLLGQTKTGRPWKYTPDFFVVAKSAIKISQVPFKMFKMGSFEFHEVKGYHRGRERGIAKFLAAKTVYPWFKWILVDE